MSKITIGGYRDTTPSQGSGGVATPAMSRAATVGTHRIQTGAASGAAVPNHVATGIVPSARSAQVPLAQRNAAPASAPAFPLSAAAANAALTQLAGKAIDPRVARDFVGKIGLDHLGRVTAQQSAEVSITQDDVNRLQGATVKSPTLTNSKGERQMRSEREIVMDFVSTLTKARGKADEAGQAKLDAVIAPMRALWLGSDLNTASAVLALRTAGADLAGILPQLSAIATQFGNEVAKGIDPHGNKPVALYHDNVLGRRFESEVVQAMVKAPPQPVLDTAKAVGTFLCDMTLLVSRRNPPAAVAGDAIFDGHPINAGSATGLLKPLADFMQTDPRPWHAETPEIQTFIDTMNDTGATAQDKVDAFAAMMTSTQNGFDVMKQSFLGVKLSLVLDKVLGDAGVDVPWMKAANKNYGDVVVAARTITPAVGGKVHLVDAKGHTHPDAWNAHGVETRGFGTSLPHQPGLTPDAIDTSRWMPGKSYPASVHTDVTSSRIKDFERGALFNNQNNVNGASGSTNIMTHLFIDMLSRNIPIDLGDAFAGTMMFLTYDGGHSLPESTGTFRSILSATDLSGGEPTDDELAIRRDILATHVLSYNDLGSYFSSAETRAAVSGAVDTAFGRTQTFFEEIRSERAAS